MGLINAIRRQLLKIIKWDDDSQNTIVYRYPMEDRDEIMNGCQLVVTESQVAMLVLEGQIADVFGPGTHRLETKNIPILTKLKGWKYDFESPFKADVYYVNTKQMIDLKWGTATRVPMRDADFGVIRIGGRGKYSFKVVDAKLFMKEIFGTNRSYSTDAIKDYLKSIIISCFTDVVGTAKIPALDLAARYNELSEETAKKVEEHFSKIGIQAVAIYVENISLPEEVETAMDQRASVGVLKDEMSSFTQYQAAQAMREAAKNNTGGGAGLGVGLGAGVVMGQTMMNAMNQQSSKPEPTNQSQTSSLKCTNCGEAVAPGAKFCSNCGSKVQQVRFCSKCGSKVSPDAKFCSSCGEKL